MARRRKLVKVLEREKLLKPEQMKTLVLLKMKTWGRCGKTSQLKVKKFMIGTLGRPESLTRTQSCSQTFLKQLMRRIAMKLKMLLA